MAHSYTLHLTNTLGRTKEPFIPRMETDGIQAQGKNVVSIYTCGPTVYGDPHIGNMRAFANAALLADTIRYLLDYTVRHTLNITDVGHLTDDGDDGEDKMQKGARQQRKTAREVAEMYTQIFFDQIDALNLNFDNHPRATEYIQEQLDMVLALEKNGLTYIIEGDGVYFDTAKTPDYGKLLPPQHLAGLKAGARVSTTGKRNPTDFALWKFVQPDEQRDMVRDSPRGPSFPGWHIECSAMARATLGDYLDIHTGGVDHIPVHHTNEIVQSEYSFTDGNQRCKYWLHTEFLNIDNTKVSKSLGNIVTLTDVIERGYDPMDLKYFYQSAQYSSFLDFTWESLDAARNARTHIIKKLAQYTCYDIPDYRPDNEIMDALTAGLLDDLHTPSTLAALHTALHNLTPNNQKTTIQAIYWLDHFVLKLGIYDSVCQVINQKASLVIPPVVADLAEQRRDAKRAKDYDLADKLRQQIEELGYIINDTSDGWDVEKSR